MAKTSFAFLIVFLQACVISHQQAPAVQIQNYEGPIYVHAVSPGASTEPQPVPEEQPQIIVQTPGTDRCPPISVEYFPASRQLTNRQSAMCVPINNVSERSCGTNTYSRNGRFGEMNYPSNNCMGGLNFLNTNLQSSADTEMPQFWMM